MSQILLVEDTAIIREPLAAAISHAGYDTITATNGAEALELLKQHRPDLIITDIVMPVMNGLSFLHSLRQDPRTKDIPAMVLSEVTQKECIVKCIRLGISGYILKGRFSLQQLLTEIDKKLSTAPQQPAETTNASATPTPNDADAPASTPDAPASTPASDVTTSAQPQPAGPTKIEYEEHEDPVATLKSLKPIVTRSEVNEIVEECGELKAMSPTVAEVLKLTGTDRCSIEQVSRAISRDHAIALKILKLANSAVYTRGEPVDSVHDAVLRIGLEQIRQAVLNISVVDQFTSESGKSTMDVGQFWEHAIAVGMIAAELARARGERDTDAAFTMGLLHDIGKMVYLTQLGDTYVDVVSTAHKLRLPVEQVESRVLLLNHADLMDRVLHHWKFPKQLINPIVFHHLSASNIRSNAPREINEVATLGLANRLAHAMMLGSSGNETIYPTHELCQLLKTEPAVIRQIEQTTRQETDKVKFALLANSAQGSWPQLRDQYSAELNTDFRPLFVSASPEHDAYGIFCRQLSDTIGDEEPNVGVIHITHARDRVNLTSQYRTAEQRAGVTNLPLIILSPGAKLTPEEGLLAGRECVAVGTPFVVQRFLSAVRRVLNVEQPAAAA